MENREIFVFDCASTPNEAMLSTMQNGPKGPWTLACDMCIVLLVCFNASTLQPGLNETLAPGLFSCFDRSPATATKLRANEACPEARRAAGKMSSLADIVKAKVSCRVCLAAYQDQ